jgi:hypothetical protein
VEKICVELPVLPKKKDDDYDFDDDDADNLQLI